MFKKLGQKIAQIVRQDGQYLSPLLAAFTARVITLEQSGRYPVEGPNAVAVLPPAIEDELIHLTIQRCMSHNEPMFETIKMQLTFESFYAFELNRLRKKQEEEDKRNSAMLDAIVQVGSNLNTSQQVATLYRMLFKLLLSTSTVPDHLKDRNVEREIAVALESVFPQSGLNAFSLCTAEQKRQQVLNMVNVVLGVRLFNRAIKHGGAGLDDIPALCAAEMDTLYERLEAEAQEMGDICFTLSDLCLLEVQQPGTLTSSARRLQEELTNRRQYVLLLHQLQHEVLDAVEQMKALTVSLEAELAQVKAVVGVRSAVPKDQVYPLFHSAASAWRGLLKERERNALRVELLAQLQQFRTSFDPAEVEQDLPKLKMLSPDKLAPLPPSVTYTPSGAVDISAFVETIVDSDAGIASAATNSRPQRLLRETTLNFMALPLETQGYCPWTIVMRGGLLIPGDPALGVIRYKGRHYSFSSVAAMCGFCQDPDKFVDGLVSVARRQPALVHLLGLQPYIPVSDIADFLSADDSTPHRSTNGRPAVDAQTQLSDERINTDELDPHYEWNEWRMRERIIKMANLCNMRTTSTQTRQSHFRRDSSTQTTVKQMLPDGTMPGTGTQTMVDKGTNVARVHKYEYNMRGKPNGLFRTVVITTPDHVINGTNGDLTDLATKIVSRPIIREF